MAQWVKNLPAVQEMPVQSLGQEDPLQEGLAAHSFSCLENPMDRGAWWATVHRVTKSPTELKRLSTNEHASTAIPGPLCGPGRDKEGLIALILHVGKLRLEEASNLPKEMRPGSSRYKT